MTKYVIGAMSSVDTPLSPAVKGSKNLTAIYPELRMNGNRKRETRSWM